MEQFFIEIYNFLTSTQFTMYLTMGLAIFTVIMKIITSVSKAKNNLKLANFESKVKIKDKELQAIYNQTEALKDEAETYKAFIQEIWNAINSQNDALGVAFDNSNLNASAKIVVKEKLESAKNILQEAHATAINIQEEIKEVVEEVKENVAPIVEEITSYTRVK